MCSQQIDMSLTVLENRTRRVQLYLNHYRSFLKHLPPTPEWTAVCDQSRDFLAVG